MAEKKFSLEEALKFGWERTKSNIGFLIGVMLVSWLAQAIPSHFEKMFKDSHSALYIVFFLISTFVGGMVTIGLVKISLSFCDHGTGEFNDLLSGLPVFANYFVASLLFSLAVMGGCILLIVPGIILAVRLGFYPYLIIDRNMTIMESLKQSFEVTKGSTMDLFLFGIVAVIVNLVGLVCLLVGLLVTVPVTMIATAYVYRKFFPATPISPQTM